MTFEEWWKSSGMGLWERKRELPHETDFAKSAWEAATLAEREACARVCENTDLHRGDHLKNSDPRVTCAAAIRAR